MGKKFVLIGAGSYVFTRNLVRDILTYPAFRDAELHLVDINPVNLENARKAVMHIVEAGQYPAKVFCTTDRREALKGADGVLSVASFTLTGALAGGLFAPVGKGGWTKRSFRMKKGKL